MSRSLEPLPRLVRELEHHYGAAPAPYPDTPFPLVLWENVAYLASDEKRREAFEQLEAEIGLDPVRILTAPEEVLLGAARGGILAEKTVGKLREVARLALEIDLDAVVQRAPREAKRALRKFPGIGEPGSEKILLFTRRHSFLAPDSNALRVLSRFGLCPDLGSYAKTYSGARELADSQIGDDLDRMIAAHQLLRRLGQELCKRKEPRCESCPVRADCQHARSAGRAG